MRTSRRIHPSFILAKGRSLGFASASADSWRPVRTRFRFGCAHPLRLTSPATATRRLIMQKARRHPIRGSDRLQAHGFRVCFTPLLEVLFTFPSRYLCAIGLSVVFSLTGWSPQIPSKFHVYRRTQDTTKRFHDFAYRAITFSSYPFQNILLSRNFVTPYRGPTTPVLRLVWAISVSLATTQEIDFSFSSTGY